MPSGKKPSAKSVAIEDIIKDHCTTKNIKLEVFLKKGNGGKFVQDEIEILKDYNEKDVNNCLARMRKGFKHIRDDTPTTQPTTTQPTTQQPTNNNNNPQEQVQGNLVHMEQPAGHQPHHGVPQLHPPSNLVRMTISVCEMYYSLYICFSCPLSSVARTATNASNANDTGQRQRISSSTLPTNGIKRE